MEPFHLSKSDARKIIINAAGLRRKAQFGTGLEAVYRVIDHLGFLQLDTNYVVERAHHQVLASRIPDYDTDWLDQLIDDGRIYEYFSSDAGYHPMCDFRFSLPVKYAFEHQAKTLSKAETNLMNHVLDRVEREGALAVGDFENDRLEASSGWWDWRPAKVALERLYLYGKLMIHRSKNFQKRYDLPFNLVQQDTDSSMPTAEEYARFIIQRSIGALGIASIKEMAWRARRVKGHLLKEELEKMIRNAEIQPVFVEGLKGPLYMRPDSQNQLELSNEVFILSPFDILNVFRHRLKDFFNFDYQIECFLPAEKRKYGYFSLPILAGEHFIARMDAKANRKQKVLIIHNIHFEDVALDEIMLKKLSQALKEFILFNKCHDVIFKRSNNESYLAELLKYTGTVHL